MVENLGRKIFWIALLLVASLLMILVPDRPFRLGLDLQGGTRLLYRIDFDQALELREISQEEYANRSQLLQDTLDIIRERVDPNGLLEASFRPQGEERFVIEIPRSANLASVEADAPLREELRPGERVLTLGLDPQVEEQQELLRNFSSTGGVIGIGAERIKYVSRVGNQLFELKRGFGGTEDARHPAGDTVTLISDDPIRSAIENPGSLQFYIVAIDTDFMAKQPGTDATTEGQRVRDWIAANPNLPITLYNLLPFEEGGAPENIKWFPTKLEEGQDPNTPLADRLLALLVPDETDWRFDSADLKTVNQGQDQYGYPAVALEMTPSAAPRFGSFTKTFVRRNMAVVVNDEVVTYPTINEPLYGRYQISGGQRGFTLREVQAMVKVLRSGSFKIKPELEEEERIGASLGDQYVRSGGISAIVGLAAVLVFMMLYYRKLGVFAAISLVCNLILLMGAMAFLKATLTLPGVAGVILTVGMAVDANILIYERIREETKRGRKIAQAAKNGFERAMVTIVDANVTTFLTAFILRYVGTGPVRGFATTLMIGIITSMFSALVITRVLVALSIAKGTEGFKMTELVKATKISFMALSKKVMIVSLTLTVAGVALFASEDDKKKFSIDFLGGFTVTVRTEEPQAEDTIRGLIKDIPGNVGQAEVAPILDSGDRSEGYRKFRITYKAQFGQGGADAEDEGGEKTGETEIKNALAGLLQKGPVTVAVDAAANTASGRLYFEEEHPPADVQGILGEILSDPAVTEDVSHPGCYEYSSTVVPGSTPQVLEREIAKVFVGRSGRADSNNVRFSLAEAVPEAAVVGAQVAGELVNKAVAAILLSLFVVVMYIRVRFAEYSYGLAAVAALVHDVLFVLGALAVANMTGFLNAEISLPMIAAFLTIIGYSLNDTIVVFDRVRENLPRMKGSLAEIMDTSINQCLSRTVLTSLTTLVAVLILLIFNYGGGSVLEGFSFALLIGVMVGTYSSMFIASPVFLWLETRARRKTAAAPPPPAEVSAAS